MRPNLGSPRFRGWEYTGEQSCVSPKKLPPSLEGGGQGVGGPSLALMAPLRPRFACILNSLQDVLHRIVNLFIHEANNLVACRSKFSLSIPVSIFVSDVYVTIHLDSQSPLPATEVDNVIADPNLPAELKA